MTSRYLFISKLDSVKRQLELAIKLFLINGDVVAIHTLTAAAHHVLWDLGRKQEIQSIIKEKIIEQDGE